MVVGVLIKVDFAALNTRIAPPPFVCRYFDIYNHDGKFCIEQRKFCVFGGDVFPRQLVLLSGIEQSIVW